MSEVVASVRSLVKRFAGQEVAALDGVSIDIAPGKMTGLVGPDGAGKTTLIRILAGLIDPDAGQALVFGRPATDSDRSMIGYMPQRFGLYEDLSVIENLRLYANLRGLPREEHQASFDRLLAFTDLKRFADRLAGKLSGGMKQKLGLACAMVRAPKLLLLDEPGVGVDPVSRRELWQMVKDLAGDGIGVIWSTAYLDEAEKCDTVMLLSEGKGLYDGPPQALTDRIGDRVLRAMVPSEGRRAILSQALDDAAIIDGTVQGDALRLMLRAGSAAPAPQSLGLPAHVTLDAVRPRFEDAFIDLLGGGPSGTSQLAAHYRTIPATDKPAIVAQGLTRRLATLPPPIISAFLWRAGRFSGFSVPTAQANRPRSKCCAGCLHQARATAQWQDSTCGVPGRMRANRWDIWHRNSRSMAIFRFARI